VDAAVARLRAIAAEDRYIVKRDGEGYWVPQLSSKRPGVVDEGHTWDNAQILQEHLRLRDQYGALLLWSGDWSVFDAPDFWVTIAPFRAATSDDALAWCRQQGLTDNNYCFAKFISTTHPPKGTTAMN